MVNENVLVLNCSWMAVNVASVRRAIALVYQDHARVVATEDFATYTFTDWLVRSATVGPESPAVHTVSFRFCVPDVIVLRAYNHFHRKEVPFSRRSLFERDRLRCQYCGRRVRRSDFTVDHVVPRSQGGRNTWDNLVLACVPCNLRKGNRTPEEANMPLLRRPRKPDWFPHGGGIAPAARKPSWARFVAPGVAWHAEVED